MEAVIAYLQGLKYRGGTTQVAELKKLSIEQLTDVRLASATKEQP